jgi:hypothetical protein
VIAHKIEDFSFDTRNDSARFLCSAYHFNRESYVQCVSVELPSRGKDFQANFGPISSAKDEVA